MDGGFVAEVVLPLAIFLIMASLGTALTTDDFRRVAAAPLQVGVGLVCQLVLLPVLGFAVASVFSLEPIFAVSIVLLAASPGGTTSNLIVHVADAERALSVTMTALSSVVVFLSMPFLLSLGFRTFGDQDVSIDFPVGEVMLQVAALTIVPVTIGMLVRRRNPEFAARIEEPSKIASGAFLGLVIVALTIQEWDLVVDEGIRFAPAFIVLNLLALGVGYGVATLARFDRAQSFTVAVETGLQNSTLAITVAISVLDINDLAIIPALYGVWMLVTGFGLAMWFRRSSPDVGRQELDAVGGVGVLHDADASEPSGEVEPQ